MIGEEPVIEEPGSTILIVDDEQIGRDVLKGLLIKQGYRLAFATSGQEALDKARELTPDLILLDVMMPDMDGFEVCRRIRSDPILAEAPVIMVTALDDRKSRLSGIEAGADSFISKPFDGMELQTQVRTITRLNRYRRLLTANRQLENKITQLSALYDILSSLNSTTDPDDLLESIIQKTKELLNVERVSIFLWDENKAGLYPDVVPVERDLASSKAKTDIPVASEVADRAFHEGVPMLVQDIDSDKSVSENCHCEECSLRSPTTSSYGSANGTTKQSLMEKELLIRSVLCVPLKGKQKIIGVIEAVNKREGRFTEDNQKLLEAMADNIALSIERANLYHDLRQAEALLRRQNADLRLSVSQKYRFENIIGNSEEITAVLKNAEQVALTDSTVLIYGETGTGKELLARAIHHISPRSQKNFVPINCGAIPKELLESELFGHERGSFTGAIRRRIGRFEQANEGTLFLDEIGDMPLNLQVRLLRVLQEGVIQRLGSNDDIEVDVRIIAATHEDLAGLIEKGEFREDLYYRLKVFQLELPPLRKRKSDIPLLINHFIAHYNEKLGKQITGLDDSALDILYNYGYPGNIRELQHIIESAMIRCKGDLITPHDLPDEFITPRLSSKETTFDSLNIPAPRNKEELNAARDEAQKQVELLFLKEILSTASGNVAEAARRTGMNRSWLSELISKHQLDLSQFRSVG
ncbi:response regulator [Candidatus Poribacteria bacterium]|nr:response regulator [Candidatus Poribacteria bacterium]